MFTRKLRALRHHSPDYFNINDEAQFKNCVVWLEDKVIRLYKINDREPLRNTSESTWRSALEVYLQDLHAPVDHDNNAAVLGWLLSYAVRLKYREQADEINRQSSEALAQAAKSPATANPDSLANVTAENETLKAGIKSLANALSVPLQDDHIMLLEALKTLIEEQLSGEAISKANSNAEAGKKQKQKTQETDRTLKDVQLGFEIKDPAIRDAAKIIRLLHIKELREIQTKVNQAIVEVQKLTANPVTDQSLGKVGR